MNIQMKIVTVIFTCKFTVVALKLTWRVRLLIWWLTIWVGSIRFYCIRGFREAGLWLLLLLKLQGAVDLPRFCQQSETPYEPAVERPGPGLGRFGNNGNMTWTRSMLCTASESFVPRSKWTVAHRTTPVSYAATFLPGRCIFSWIYRLIRGIQHLVMIRFYCIFRLDNDFCRCWNFKARCCRPPTFLSAGGGETPYDSQWTRCAAAWPPWENW